MKYCTFSSDFTVASGNDMVRKEKAYGTKDYSNTRKDTKLNNS